MSYRIKSWDETFENNRSRVIDRLTWVAIPNAFDGDGYVEIMQEEDGVTLLGVWDLLVRLASRVPKESRDGRILRRGDKPHTARTIASVTRAPEAIIQRGLDYFMDLGWLEEAPERQAGVTRTSGERQASVTRLSHMNVNEGKEGRKEGRGNARAREAPPSASQEEEEPCPVLTAWREAWSDRHGAPYPLGPFEAQDARTFAEGLGPDDMVGISHAVRSFQARHDREPLKAFLKVAVKFLPRKRRPGPAPPASDPVEVYEGTKPEISETTAARLAAFQGKAPKEEVA